MPEPTFLDLIDRLTRTTLAIVPTDAGAEVKDRPGLIPQLRQAVFTGMENTGGSSPFGSKPPIDTAAADLLNEITRQAAEALTAGTHIPAPNTAQAEELIRLWAAQTADYRMTSVTSRATLNNADQYLEQFKREHPGQPLPPTVFDEITELSALNLVRRWVDRIEDFFNPPSSREIPFPCPTCGERYVYRLRDGQHVRSCALNLIRDRETLAIVEARCSNCAETWTPAMFERLAVLVGGKTFDQVQAEWAEADALEAARLAKKNKTTRNDEAA